MKKNEQHPHIFLIRMWREPEQNDWRFVLKTPQGNVQHGFDNLPDLFAFFEHLVNMPDPLDSSPELL